MSKMYLPIWQLAHLQVVTQGPRLLPHCGSVTCNMWFPGDRAPLQEASRRNGGRGAGTLPSQVPQSERITHDFCSYSTDDTPQSHLDAREAGKVVVIGKWFPGDNSIPPLLGRKSPLQMMSQFLPIKPVWAIFLFPLQRAWLLLFRSRRKSNLCLYVGTILTWFLRKDSHFQFPSNML